MEGIQFHAPKPPAHVRAAIARDRGRLEEDMRRHHERAVERRARAITCPGCGFGGFDGYCIACTYSAPAPVEYRRHAR